MSESLKRITFFIGIFIPILLWIFIEVDPFPGFVFDVPRIGDWHFLETQYLYLYVHLFVMLPVLMLSFDKKVAYHRSWKYLFPAMVIIGALFIIWDMVFTSWKVWGFNPDYFLGHTVGGLPIEECLFFITVPFASIFIHACLMAYFPKDHFRPFDKTISIAIGLTFLILSFIHLDKIYTSTTFALTGTAVLFHYGLFRNTYRTLFYRSFLLVLVPFLLVDGILTGGYTQAPVVLYHPDEYLGWRLTSAPVEDSVYGFLMLLLILTLMDWMGWNGRKIGKSIWGGKIKK